MTDIVLRDATPADLPAIHAIYAHHVMHGLGSFEETPPSLEEITQRYRAVRDKNMPYLVVTQSSKILGYAYAGAYRPRIAYRYTVEDSIYVAHDAAGKGVGKILLSELLARCTAMDFRQMVAVIGDSANTGSIGLHKALGFEMIGNLKSVGFKFGRWIDSIYMQRALGPGDKSLPEK
ncbi:MAG: N-acetyltransferase family protein [Rhodospirillales bacterium]